MLVTAIPMHPMPGGISRVTGPEGERFIRTLRRLVRSRSTVKSLNSRTHRRTFAEDGTLVDLGFTMFLMLRDNVPDWALRLLQQPTTTDLPRSRRAGCSSSSGWSCSSLRLPAWAWVRWCGELAAAVT